MTTNTPSKLRRLCQFWKDQSGAVTVDWVVLTAAAVGLALIMVTFFRPEVFQAAADKITLYIGDATAFHR